MDQERPAWWPDWVPRECSNDHVLLPRKVTMGWVHCTCPGAGPARGHHEWRCNACDWSMLPPGHTGELPVQR